MNYHIRWMIRRDLVEVITIEQENFEWAWSEDDFVYCLRRRNCIGRVIERDNKIVGFMIYALESKCLDLVNFAVAKDYQRTGLGRAMVDHLIEKLTPQKRVQIKLHIRETNLAGQKFFREMGFRATSIKRNFYDNTTEDAYVMRYEIPTIQTIVQRRNLCRPVS